MCNEEMENEDGFVAAKLIEHNLTGCQKHLKFEHKTGCTVYSALKFTNFLNSNAWFSGTCLLGFGLVVGLFGQKEFLHIAGASAAFLAFFAWMLLASMCMWMNTTIGVTISTILALGAGAAAYFLFKRPRGIKFGGGAAGLLCLFGGFMLGSIVEGVIIAAFGWESLVFYLIVTIGCMLFASYMGWTHPQKTKRWLTAMLGSYFCMRGFTFYFGGFPSEMDMYANMVNPSPDFEHFDFSWMFWLYVGAFCFGCIMFAFVQNHVPYFKAPKKTKGSKKTKNGLPKKAKGDKKKSKKAAANDDNYTK
jgi:MFS family permease